MLQLVHTPVTHLLLQWAKNIRKSLTVDGGKKRKRKALLLVDGQPYTHIAAARRFVVTVSKGKGKVFPLQSGVAQTVGRGITLLFHDRGTRRR